MLTPIALSHELRTFLRGAISVNSMFARHLEAANVVVVPITDKDATWLITVRDVQPLINRLARISTTNKPPVRRTGRHSASIVT